MQLGPCGRHPPRSKGAQQWLRVEWLWWWLLWWLLLMWLMLWNFLHDVRLVRLLRLARIRRQVLRQS